MKLKSYILVGYIISTLLTILVVFGLFKNADCERRDLLFAWDDHRCQPCRCWD